ncbi:EDM2-like protein1 [Raphanus sativus]|uniref:Protein ENHANCED DOWNY MILDEW 2 n=1 Tax=Raphanus sativus TaxID=3726 RepID=A0A6J0NFC5_RAPSA|nr:protein ENHANCED DOWNY MILDEW 2 [Raphanus sativus]KAJ4900833.1 EDM2-like protein1 [Raphanus sativus]
MDSSDEEGQILPDYVDNYSFVDQTDIPVKFCLLPAKWDDDDEEEDEDPAGSSRWTVYLRGSSSDCGGNESVRKLAKAWKFDMSEDERLKIQVLLHGMRWITLLKPAKSYEGLVRTALVTLQCLHFAKRNPEASSDLVWRSLDKVDGIQPSEHDLSDHVNLVCRAMKMDEDLTKSKCLRRFLQKTSQTTPTEVELPTQHQEDAQSPKEHNFLVDDMLDEENSSDDGFETNLQFDTVCSICDNGGYILCCEGSCLRAFHPTIADGVDTSCESLGFPSGTQVHALREYFCNNCLYKQHQCFACGQLGSSDENFSQEVFPCSASNCGHFYHPTCVAKLLHDGDQIKTEELQAKISAKDPFFCPLHICKVCKTSENKNLFALHFAVCRRCPTAYHRKCLPREITSELNCDEITPQRTWEQLLPYNRILIYCLNHELVGNLATPARDHLVFPDVSGPRRTLRNGLEPVKEDVPSMVTGSKYHEGINKSRKPRMNFSVNDYLNKRRIESSGKTVSKEEGPPDFADPNDVDHEDVESRVLSIIDEVESSFSFEEFVKSRGESHAQCYNSRNDIGKNITTGLVETHANAARAALKMFKAGRGEAARAIFDPDLLVQLMKHKTKLEIYLSPFLHGMRYTSFGRHFTKLGKLKEIVERLHHYVQNGDTIVDFCCGSNDFSCLMKEKLEKTGKSCFFKNFDLILPKNTFNFEKRDWMSVKKEELPDGSRLIMGLNPPFGFKSSLANTFIMKALEFKPKILILIVPSETKRVDVIAEYDLIWEDANLLAGKSFYLPGSIDVHNKTIEQWNNIPPPLYLWSRKDWGWDHKAIALQQGHIKHMYHSTYTVGLHHAELPRDDSMVQDMEISPLD